LRMITRLSSSRATHFSLVASPDRARGDS
jgi:hypothetical protein